MVLGDEPGLRQVLSNLMSNALRHTSPGSPVEVRLAVRDDAPGAAGTVVVDVVDHGPGLSPAAAARVFERFYRADEARSRDHGGTGLGLAIVDSVVAAHGGRVELVTAPGQGATFRVLLPLAP